LLESRAAVEGAPDAAGGGVAGWGFTDDAVLRFIRRRKSGSRELVETRDVIDAAVA
jgi:hypothetical protein